LRIREEDMLEDASASSFRQYLTIARLLAGQLDFQSAIRAVAKEIALIIPHDHMDVCIITPGSTFHTAYESGLETDWSKRPPARIDQSPIRALLVGEVDRYITPDASRDPRFHFEGSFSDPIREHGLKSRLHVALKVRGETIGALSFSSLTEDDYTARDLAHAQSIGDLLAPYFFAIRAAEQAKQSAIVEAAARVREEALRQGAARLTELLEAERQRIGMDLHDQTLGDLTRFAKRLERLTLMDSVPGEKLEPLFRSLQQSMQDLRQIIEQARPSVLQLFGLVDAIENHLDRSIRDSGLSTTWGLYDESDGESGRLSANVAITLFRIAQEAINNAVRHSQAARITVAFSLDNDTLALEIADNGIGMGKTAKPGGNGLDNMRVRARLIGARFSCGSEADKTFVRVKLPITDEKENQ
jgi:signal transduction histidine kinase